MDILTSIFALVGFIFCCVLFIGWCYTILLLLSYSINELIYKYKYKHRFDKPPLAKCYCKDCKKWNPDTWACNDGYHSRLMGPARFCCFADPIDLKELKRRHKNEHDRLGKTGNRNSKGKSQK